MDHRETFVLTLFCDPQRSADPRGRLRHVASNREATFKSLEELTGLLRQFVIDEEETRDDKKGT
jgi:hypothetical protein